MYFYIINGSDATLIGRQDSYDKIVAQETYPARIDHPDSRSVLSYSESEGIHWEYIPLTQKELRERAYETEKCITYDGETLTVDEANKRWQEYQAEGNVKSAELTALIVSAKTNIRERYPDN